MKLLLIDDSGFSIASTKKILEQIAPNLIVLEALNVQDGLVIFDAEQPQLVITDLVMPGDKGDTVVKYIRAKNQTCFVTVMSANVQMKVKQNMFDLGANHFIDKPVNVQKLQELFKIYLNQQKSS